MSEKLTVLVTGSTGQQGGALARLLLQKGHKVRGLTRNPDSPKAGELKGLGAEIVSGNFDEAASLEKAAEGVDAVFAMGTPFEAGSEAETKQAIAIADAAKAAGVKHLLYNSVANADRNTGIPHFDSKYKVEEHIKALGVPYTIVAPVYFMENLLTPFALPGLKEGNFAMAIPADRKLKQTTVRDVSTFDLLVLERRNDFLGKRIDIASDEHTGTETSEILSSVTGHKIDYFEAPIDQARTISEDYALMLEWWDRVGYSADIAGLRRDYPEVGWHTLKDWAKAQDWNALD